MTTSQIVRSVAVFDAAAHVLPITEGRPLRCASVLKPIYAWVADDSSWWDVCAAASVRMSDHVATDQLVAANGGVEGLRVRIAERTGIDVGVADTWGRFEVTAPQVATMYAALAADSGRRAARIVGWMQQTPVLHRLGISSRWGTLTRQPHELLAAKSGWDRNDDEPSVRTHIVVMGPVQSVVILTSVPCSTPRCTLWTRTLEERGPSGLLPLHRAWAGDVLHRSMIAASRATKPVAA